MKSAWKDGTAPTRTLDVSDFVERHVHENFAVSMGPKPLPRHKHLEGTRPPLIVRNPPHRVHKSLNLNKSSMGNEGGAISNQIKIKGRRAVKKDNKLQHHPYAHAAKFAKGQSSMLGGLGDNDGDINNDMSSSPLFTKAGIIGPPEFDAYDKYRLDIFPFKEALKHEVNKLVLQKQKVDKINRELREECRRQLLEERMRGGSGRHRGRHVQEDDDIDNTTEGDEDDITTTEGDDTDTTADGTDDDDDDDTDNNDEEESNEEHKDASSCMCSDCLNKYTPL